MAALPLIIDCDPGIDDAIALLLACASPEFELRAVTCVAGNRPVDIAAHNACRVLDLAGRADVPVHAGCARPVAYAEPRVNLVHGEDGLGGALVPAGHLPAARHAVDALAQALAHERAGTVTLAGIGPLTNLALLEIQRPGLLKRARQIVVMGGAAFRPGNITPSAEFNFYADALAARTVLQSGADLVLFGLDVTSRAVVRPEWLASLAETGTRCGAAAHAMLRGHGRPNAALHDVCPLAWLIDPAAFVLEACRVAVDSRPGLTEGYLWARRMPAEGPADAGLARVAIGIEPDAVLSRVRERLLALP